MKQRNLQMVLAGLALLLAWFAFVGDSHAGIPTERAVPRVSTQAHRPVRANVAQQEARSVVDVQMLAGDRPEGFPKITVQGDQPRVEVEHRATAQDLFNSMRRREDTSRRQTMRVMTRQRALAEQRALHTRSQTTQASLGGPDMVAGRVEAVGDQLRVGLQNNVVVELELRVLGPTQPTVKQFESAMAELPGKIAFEPTVPDVLVYQDGVFSLSTVDGNIGFRVKEVSDLEPGEGQGVGI